MNTQILKSVDPSWQPLITEAIKALDQDYWQHLLNQNDWLPGHDTLFNAFSLPLSQTHFILFGESPYPRKQSANGYAFWDAAVTDLWSENGLSKPVNRATSLRNFIKMLLVSDGFLALENTTPNEIAQLEKKLFVSNIAEFFNNFLNHGILLLNASLVYDDQKVSRHVKQWQPFVKKLLALISQTKPNVELILFGNLAKTIQLLPEAKYFSQFCCEHPYNLSFIANQNVQTYFKKFRLLYAK